MNRMGYDGKSIEGLLNFLNDYLNECSPKTMEEDNTAKEYSLFIKYYVERTPQLQYAAVSRLSKLFKEVVTNYLEVYEDDISSCLYDDTKHWFHFNLDVFETLIKEKVRLEETTPFGIAADYAHEEILSEV